MPPLSAKASFKKSHGVLELSNTHLQWTENGKGAPTVRMLNTTVTNLFASKEGSTQAKLKVIQSGDEAGYLFTFTSPQALVEREKFKSELTPFISILRNKEATTKNAKVTKNPSTVQQVPTPTRPVTAASTPAVALARSQPLSRAVSISNDRRASTPVIVGNDAATDFRMRKTVLMSNPELLTLHRELVMTGQITEAEFWEGREHLLLAQAATEKQKKGKSGEMVNPKPKTVDGESKFVMTPKLIEDMFHEYPVVKKAYDENVPGKIEAAEFWRRYFMSKLYDFHQASIRSAAAQHIRKPDPIFDKYLEKQADGLESNRERPENIDRMVDLGSTNEDRGEAWNEKDVTMQAGRQKGVLPLIRKFNEHSERLLNTSLGEGSSKRRKLDNNEAVYSQIDLDDLHHAEASAGIQLDVQDRQRYFEGRATTGDGQVQEISMTDAAQAVKFNVDEWSANLSQLKIERTAGDAALLTMTKNVASRSDTKSKQSNIPEDLMRSMTSCQTAANEFLRQFWSSIYPQVHDTQTASATATPAQREAKAIKMIGYLVKTPAKVDALVISAQKQGVDPESVRQAMKPVLDAVDRAVSFQENKKPLR